jgi:hypothetical protein
MWSRRSFGLRFESGRRVFAGDCESHELIEGHTVFGIDVQQLWRNRGKLQSLLDDIHRDEEGAGDLLLGLAVLAQVEEARAASMTTGANPATPADPSWMKLADSLDPSAQALLFSL